MGLASKANFSKFHHLLKRAHFLSVLEYSKKCDEQHNRRHKTTLDWASQMVRQVRRWLGKQRFILVGDGGFATGQLAFELEDDSSTFWNLIFDLSRQCQCGTFNGNKACGLIFGFGEMNSTLFAREAEKGTNGDKPLHRRGALEDFGENNLIWANFLYEQGCDSFLIPGFMAFDGDALIKKYKNERKKNRLLYKGSNFLQVTLDQMRKNPTNMSHNETTQ